MRESLVRSALRYAVGSGLGLAASIARVGLAARVLPTDLSGMWLGLQLVVTYGQHVHCGVLFGMFRNIPLEAARGDSSKAERIKGTAFTFLLVATALGTLIPSVFLSVSKHGPPVRYVIATGVLLCLTLLRSFYVTVFKAESDFQRLSESSALGSFICVGTLAMIVRYGLDGLIWGACVQAAVEMGYLAINTSLPRLTFERELFWEQLVVGVPALATTVLVVVLGTLDRTLMLRGLGARATGLYYLGANILALMPMVVGLPSAVLTPRFFEQYGATGRPSDLRMLVQAPIQAAAVGVATVVGAGELALRPLVARVWPNLAAGNRAVALALIASYPLVLVGLVTNVFYALNRQVVHTIILVSVLAVYFVVGRWGTASYPDITFVAAIGCLAQWVYYGAATVAAFGMMEDVRAGMRIFASSLLPLTVALAYAAALSAGIGRLLSPSSVRFGITAEMLYLVPMAVWTGWRFQYVRRLVREK